MIAALRGRLTRWDEGASTVWLEVGGVTYEVLVPAFTGEWVETLDGDVEVQLFTFYHVSERNPTPLLIGFQHHAEREFFRKFLDVPDVGPTKAVRALTRPVSEIARWIEGGDTKSLEQLPGIGRRLSQTIVATLSGKLLEEALLRDAPPDTSTSAIDEASDLREDAVAALVSLQYTAREADQIVVRVMRERPELASIEDLLRAVLEQQAPA